MKKELWQCLISTVLFLTAGLGGAETSSSSHDTSFPIEDATIRSVHDAIKNHEITCEQLTHAYLERIKKYNLGSSKSAPVNAFTAINPNVINQARQLDRMFSQTGQFSGALHCVPVVVKDNIDTYDSTTTSGTLALLGNQPDRDAFLVFKLRQAGALVIGKGSMDELGSGMSGISSRSGRIGNAFDPHKNPGGSSGGSAVAVSAGFALIGIGTDNSGSVRIPAAFNGIAGLRPGTGLISQNGLFPAGNLDGVAGPLARNVEDLARVLEVIAVEDPKDTKTVHVPRVVSYTAYLNKNGLNGKRIGVVRQVGNFHTFESMPDEITQILTDAFKNMEQSGAQIIDHIRLPQFNNERSDNMAGMRQDIDAYLSSYPAVRKDFQDLCDSDKTRVFGDANQCKKFFRSMPDKYRASYKKALATFKSLFRIFLTIKEESYKFGGCEENTRVI